MAFLRFTEGAFFLPALGFTLGKPEVRDNITIKISLDFDAISAIVREKSDVSPTWLEDMYSIITMEFNFPRENILFSPSRTDPSLLLNVSLLADGGQTDALITNTAPSKLIKLLMTFAVHLHTFQAARVFYVHCISLKCSNNKPLNYLVDWSSFPLPRTACFCASLCTKYVFWCWKDSIFIFNLQSPEHCTVKYFIY